MKLCRAVRSTLASLHPRVAPPAAVLTIGSLAATLLASSVPRLTAQQTPAAAGGRSATAQRPGPGSRFRQPDPINFTDHQGWTQLFDGKTLNGWDGDPQVWHVEDGAIVGVSSPEHPSGTTNIIFRGGQFADFALKLEVKLEGDGANGGVQFRSANVPPAPRQMSPEQLAQMTPEQKQRLQQMEQLRQKNAKWNIKGYQADIDAHNRYSGQIYEQDSPRGIIAWRGQVVEAEKGRNPRLIATLGSQDELASFFKPGEWNQLEIVAIGNQLTTILNGHAMAGLIDNDPTYAQPKGLIAVEIEGPGNVRILHRDIWIKTF